MAKVIAVNPEERTIETWEVRGFTDFMEKMKEFIKVDTGHVMLGRKDDVMMGNFHDDWGRSRQQYGIAMRFYSEPIMGPSVFYAERQIMTKDGPDSEMCDFPFELEAEKNIKWLWVRPGSNMIELRPTHHDA